MAVAVAELGHPPEASYQPRAELTPPQTLEDCIASIKRHNPQSLSPFGQDPDDLSFTVPQFYIPFRNLKRSFHGLPAFVNWEPTDPAISELAAFSGFEVLNDSQIKPDSVAVAYYRPKNPEERADFLRKIRPLLTLRGRAVLLVPSERQVVPQKKQEVYDFFDVDMAWPIVYPKDPGSGELTSALLAVFRLLPFTYVHQ